MTNDIRPIYTAEYTHIRGWTFANFLAYVQYEAMFNDTCVRVPLGAEFKAASPDTAVRYKTTLKTTGYNGFPVVRETTIFLSDPDGDVPEFDPEVDSVNIGMNSLPVNPE